MPHWGAFTIQQSETTLPQVACLEDRMVSVATPMENPTALHDDTDNIPRKLPLNLNFPLLDRILKNVLPISTCPP